MNLHVLRRRRTRLPVSAVVLWLLLLQAAMPLLAHAAAQWQGRALVEVCTQYGVRLVDPASPAAPDDLPPAPSASHGNACALTLLAPAVLPAVEPRLASLRLDARAALPPPQRPGLTALDADARWQARRKQGPPAAPAA